MTVLDRFLDFARALPADRLQTVEDVLEAIMNAAEPGVEFSATELAELDRRMAEPDPRYASGNEVESLFQRTSRQ